MKLNSFLPSAMFFTAVPPLFADTSSTVLDGSKPKVPAPNHTGVPFDKNCDMRCPDSVEKVKYALFLSEQYEPSLGDKTYEVGVNTNATVLDLVGVDLDDVELSTNESNNLFAISKPDFSPPFKITIKDQFECPESGAGFDHLIFNGYWYDREDLESKASLWFSGDTFVEHFGGRLSEHFLIGSGGAKVEGNGAGDGYQVERESGLLKISDGVDFCGEENTNWLLISDYSLDELRFSKNGIGLDISSDQGTHVSIGNQFESGGNGGVSKVKIGNETANKVLSRGDIEALTAVDSTPKPSLAPLPNTSSPNTSSPSTYSPNTPSPNTALPNITQSPTSILPETMSPTFSPSLESPAVPSDQPARDTSGAVFDMRSEVLGSVAFGLLVPLVF